jgi:multiple sugar transport system permease protein
LKALNINNKYKVTGKSSFYGNKKALYVFLTPTLILFIFVFIFPILFVSYTSLLDWSLLNPARGISFVGLENFKNLLLDKEFWNSLFVTIKFILMSVPLGLLLGLVLALHLNRRYPGKRFIQSLMLLPIMVAPVAAYLSFKFLLEPTYGLVNYLLGLIHLSGIGWFSDPKTALISIVIVDLWLAIPFIFLVLYASIQAVPQEQYEAAMVDGANQFQLHRFITIPSIKPVFIVVTIIRIMDAIRVFDSIYSLTKGGPANSTMTLQYLCFNYAFNTFLVGKGSATAIIIVIIILLFGILLILQLQRSYD